MVGGTFFAIIGIILVGGGFIREHGFNLIIPFGGALFLLGVVLALDDLHGMAVDWMHDHEAEYNASEDKRKSLQFRLARFFAGPEGVIYLYPGGPIGSTIAMVLTISVSAVAVIVFCLILTHHLLQF